VAVETIDWVAAPALDGDDSTTYVMGCAFTVTEAVPCPGLEWHVPDPTAPNPASVDGVFWASLWEGTTRVRVVAFTPVAGTVQQIPWGDGAYPCTVGPEYTAQVLTRRYSYATGGGYPYSTPDGVGVASEGRLSTSADPTTRAAGSSSARFYVSPMLGEDEPGGIDAAGAFTLPALQLAGSGGLDDAAAGSVTLPALQAVGAGELDDPAAGALVLAALLLGGEVGLSVAGLGALTLPALDLLGVATAEGVEPDPDESSIPGMYTEIVAGLKAALRPYGLRVALGMAEPVGSRDVVVGPPTFTWEGLCDPDEPDSVTFSVFLIEAFHERATERLLSNLPALIRGVQGYRDATITAPAVPGAFPSGSSDLPCYQLTVEMTL
jgi:hypothetical protein